MPSDPEEDPKVITRTLQDVGLTYGKRCEDLELGDVVVWNFGYRSLVIDLQPCGKTMRHVTYSSLDGKPSVDTRRHKKSFVLGFSPRFTQKLSRVLG